MEGGREDCVCANSKEEVGASQCLDASRPHSLVSLSTVRLEGVQERKEQQQQTIYHQTSSNKAALHSFIPD